MNLGAMLSYACGLTSVVCWILVLVRMFKEGVLKGVLGLICGLYAFIWGWMNSGKGLQTVMLIWTIAVVVGIAIGAFAGFPTVMP